MIRGGGFCRCGVEIVALALVAGCSREAPAEPPRPVEPAKPTESVAAALGMPPPAAVPAPALASAEPPPAPGASASAPVPALHLTQHPAPSSTVNELPSAAPPVPSASAAKAADVPVVRRRGPVASGESYDVWMETTGGYAVGAPSSAVVSVSAKAPFKCNTQYPYKLALEGAPGGLSYPSAVVRGMQVDGKHASMAVPFTASKAGAFTVAGTLSFSTCTVDRCLVDKARVSVQVDVR